MAIDIIRMKRVLITGANSYIGTSFERYVLERYPGELSVDTVDMMNDAWRNKDFSEYDICFHVAGIAHADVGKVSEEDKAKYYAVNTDLAIETAKKCKEQGVEQFVIMSSIIIYGDSAPYGKSKMITADTKPSPSNFYGDSKWKADVGVRELEDESFYVTVIRPPFVYGKGCKGNYVTISKLAKILPFFPSVKNERSMLYIENLCEFLAQIMIKGRRGVFWPQNKEYVATSDLVHLISCTVGRRIMITRALNPAVIVLSHFGGRIGKLTNKAFGSVTIDHSLSEYDFEYSQVDLKKSIERTERV